MTRKHRTVSEQLGPAASGGFVPIPPMLLDRPDELGLSVREATVLIHLLRLADERHNAIISYTKLAARLECGKNTVIRAIKRLERKGWLRPSPPVRGHRGQEGSNVYLLYLALERLAEWVRFRADTETPRLERVAATRKPRKVVRFPEERNPRPGRLNGELEEASEYGLPRNRTHLGPLNREIKNIQALSSKTTEPNPEPARPLWASAPQPTDFCMGCGEPVDLEGTYLLQDSRWPWHPECAALQGIDGKTIRATKPRA